MVYTIITSCVVIASILLIGVVLIQNSKGGGLASDFQSPNKIFGVQKGTDVIEKTTWVLMSVVVIFSITAAAFYPRMENVEESQLKDQVEIVTDSQEQE